MRFRITTLLVFVTLVAIMVAVPARFFAQPSWLLRMRGKFESDDIGLDDGRWLAREFSPTDNMLTGPRKRLKSTLPNGCQVVRENRFHDTTYVYYAWSEYRDHGWFVFDTTYHHEDAQWPPSN